MSEQSKELWQKIVERCYCDPTKRMDFVLFYDVRDGNPNGDPDAGNLPRMDPETLHGIVTDVCIKRKIRDYVAAVLGRKIYIQSQASQNSLYTHRQPALNTLYFQAASEIAGDEPEKDEIATDTQRAQRVEDKKAVGVLLAVLDEKLDTEFGELIAVIEDSEHAGSADPANQEEQMPFRNWLDSIEVDGIEFDSECGVLSYLGEAKAEKDFKSLFTQEEFNYKPYEPAIGKLAKLLAKAKKEKKGGAQERKARDAVKRKMCQLYDDIRLFGAVLTAGTNAGQIRGPMQLTFGRSIEPILQMDAAITRCAITKASDWKKKQTEFGRKPWLNWAVYRQHGFYNPLLGEQTGVVREDLARFWESLACMFRNSDSASKGEMTMHDVIVFVHDHPRGNGPSHLLFDEVKCTSCGVEGVEGLKETTQQDPKVTLIRRDGFDKYYKIEVGESPFTKISIGRPLRDIWARGDR